MEERSTESNTRSRLDTPPRSDDSLSVDIENASMTDRQRERRSESQRNRRAVHAPIDAEFTDSTLLAYMFGTLSAWIGIAFGVMLMFDIWSVELYVVVSFIGFYISRLLFTPAEPTSTWWRLLDWISWIGLVVLGYILYLHVQTMIF